MIPEKKIAIIGLGYVGLPLAVEFGQKYKTVEIDNIKYQIPIFLLSNSYLLNVV